MTISVIVFAYTTMLLAEFYSETGGVYVFGNRIVMPYRIVFLVGLIVGAIGGLQVIWGLFDAFMAVTVAINLVVVVSLRKEVMRLTAEFFGNPTEPNAK